MKPTPTRTNLRFISPLVGLVAVALAACSISNASSFSADDSDPPFKGAGSENGDDAAVYENADGGTILPTETFIGSPLCRVTEASCSPDPLAPIDAGITNKAGSHPVCGADPITTDAGSSTDIDDTTDAGDIDDATAARPEVACRVRLDGSDKPTPICEAEGEGKEGATCTAGTDCAAGLDCVTTAPGVLQCRRYCCSGSCGSKMPETRFCDVAPLAKENRLVPVCAPIKACKLLSTDDCPVGETCAVVTDMGTTSCVAVGKAIAGESCEEAHCAAGLNCLGQIGARKCYQICAIGGRDCTDPQICKGNSLFKDEGFGVCQAP